MGLLGGNTCSCVTNVILFLGSLSGGVLQLMMPGVVCGVGHNDFYGTGPIYVTAAGIFRVTFTKFENSSFKIVFQLYAMIVCLAFELITSEIMCILHVVLL